MTTTRTRPATPQWDGVLDPARLQPARAKRRQALADAARDGRWSVVLAMLEKDKSLSPNHWRPGGTSLYTPLHQAAWHGAPVDVVEQLVALGAWRTLRTAKGDNALNIAHDKGHRHLEEILTPTTQPRDDLPVIQWLDLQLAELVESRIRPELDIRLRHPVCSVMAELPGRQLWYPVPGMYGWFSIQLRENHLFVESWSRVAGGSGEAHVITQEGRFLVDRGFV